MTMKMRAEDLRGYANKELRDVRLCSKNDIVALLGPPSGEQSSWDVVITNVIKSHYNDVTKRWQGFPNEKANEVEYYKPFVHLANEVCQECQSVGRNQDALNGQWVDTHSISPRERSDNKSRIQPDIVHVAFPEPVEDVSRKIDETANIDTDDKDMKKNIQFFWQQIHVLVEVKKSKPTDLSDYVLQLCSYMRQMFQEQLDRRFIINRAGLVEHPCAAISLLATQKFGWDPTMTLYVDKDCIPSYRLPKAKRSSPASNLFRDDWVISMPTNSGDWEKFLTIRLIDGAGASVLCSRATLVWEVIKLSVLSKCEDGGGVHVLKQTWPQADDQNTRPEEAVMYEHGGEGGFIYLADYVRVNGDLSSTANFRKSLKFRNFQEKGDKNKEVHDEHVEPFRDMATLTPLKMLLHRRLKNAVGRVQTRLVMKGMGYPLKHSVSCLELVTALRDCINIHKQMYLNGVLHRDISLGNLLIQTNGAGQLIDFDRAKRETMKKQVLKLPDDDSVPDPRLEDLENYLSKSGFQMDEDSKEFVLQYFSQKPGYTVVSLLDVIIEQRFGEKRKLCTSKDLGWPNKEQCKRFREFPNFVIKEAQEGYMRTGTVRYMSYQVLLMEATPPATTFLHEPYHDIESFFWVLVYICIAFQGPGGNLRPELKERSSSLAIMVDKAFSPMAENLQILGTTRRYYIKGPDDNFKELMSYLHDDFDDLSDLIKKWRKILVFSCSNAGPDRDFIHHHVLQLLNETISQLGDKRSLAAEKKEKTKKAKRRMRWAKERRLHPTGIASRTRSKCQI
ncbi:hypothetical protein AMATHDRAFT_6258 [Amanita thiersii Skay4041]|uniref:Fungal-type protein kinase domain-containing protein n=1 Tax=Amanita thiersii Skay4041 TaxID=703135 RepID=A0A2A9NJR9_9AGAR|nr:hypothetical protein AMATHDRAFT_6258 [Amanita thiersii Skay4041]